MVSKCYINLSTVESIEDFPKEKEEICTLAMIHAKVEEVKKLKRSIEIGQVGVFQELCTRACEGKFVTITFMDSCNSGWLVRKWSGSKMHHSGRDSWYREVNIQLAPWGLLGPKGDPSWLPSCCPPTLEG